MRVDETYEELRRIGCNAVNIWRGYIMSSPTSASPLEEFDRWFPGGPSLAEEEIRYAINEAHLQGLLVILSPHVAEAAGTYRYFEPPDVEQWFSDYAQLILENADVAQLTGVEILELANNLCPAAFRWPEYANRFNLDDVDG